MKRFDGFDSVPPGALTEPVCTVGVFDGVHRGHRQLIYELEVWASSVRGESCILTLDRHPLEVLQGVTVPLILSPENKLLEFERHGVDAVVVVEFEGVSTLTAREFLERLREALGCRRLLLGFDSRLGCDRADGQTLPALGAELGIEVRIASGVLDRAGKKIGSSAIRAAIQAGELERAANLLGRPFTLRGTVVHGAGRGAEMGIATANLDIEGQLLPPDGVYLVRVFRGGETAPGVANLGVRPTFGEGGGKTLEVHAPGWSGEMYGEQFEVRPFRFLRPERRFDSVDALKKQIASDLAALDQAVAEGEI